MSDENIFNNLEDQPTVEENVDQQSGSDPYADQLKMITAEDGRQKYADVDTALQSIPHAQTMINSLKATVAEQEAALAKAQGVEAVLEQLQTAPTDAPVVDIPVSTGLGAEDVSSIVEKELAKRAIQSTKESNLNVINSTLVEKFGDVSLASKAFNEKAQELGSTAEYLQQIAASNPQMVLALFDSKKTQQATPITQTVNQAGLPIGKPEFKPVMIGASTEEVISQAKQAGIFNI